MDLLVSYPFRLITNLFLEEKLGFEEEVLHNVTPGPLSTSTPLIPLWLS